MRLREANEVLAYVKTPADGYAALGIAVITLACDDWLRAAAAKNAHGMKTIEKFFKSDKFYLFSQGVDGGYVLRKLREEARKVQQSGLSRKVNAYDKHGNIVKRYMSLAEAARDIIGDRRGIGRAIASGREYHGYFWKYPQK